MSVSEILQRLRDDWATPKIGMHKGEPTTFPLVCTISGKPGTCDLNMVLPPSLAEFWRNTETARLFEDKQYGHWGLVLLSPTEAAERTEEFKLDRASYFRQGDLVVGEFIGDSDLLLVRCAPGANDFGHVIVALPLDRRDEWYDLSDSLANFLAQYEEAQGAKFWEA